MKMAVFWVVAPCSLVERRYNPEDSHFRTHRRENLKSYLILMEFTYLYLHLLNIISNHKL
jgi:hypothetical protein